MMSGHWEWFLIFLVILLLFGGRKIPEVARGLGKAIREFNKARDDVRDAIEEGDAEKVAASAKSGETGGGPPPAETAEPGETPPAQG